MELHEGKREKEEEEGLPVNHLGPQMINPANNGLWWFHYPGPPASCSPPPPFPLSRLSLPTDLQNRFMFSPSKDQVFLQRE